MEEQEKKDKASNIQVIEDLCAGMDRLCITFASHRPIPNISLNQVGGSGGGVAGIELRPYSYGPNIFLAVICKVCHVKVRMITSSCYIEYGVVVRMCGMNW